MGGGGGMVWSSGFVGVQCTFDLLLNLWLTIKGTRQLYGRALAHSTKGHQLDPSSQCSTTGLIKYVVCTVLFVGWCI